MKIFKPLRMVILIVLLVFSYSMADEGMWLLSQLKQLDWQKLQNRGLQLSPEQVQALKDAVVIIDGGTGEFVSAHGLLLTNHHVAFSALQRASSVGTNYIEQGFLAASREEEIPATGYEVRILKYSKDVTQKVLSAVKPGMSDSERLDAIAKREAKIEDAAETNDGLDAAVVSLYNGIKYRLFVYERYKDVRLVYAPPRSIGEYGGDVDNWMWPRHTGDFAFFRVYASPDGKPAKYSKENVPFRPKKFLKISEAGIKDGDFTFILGFPGRTYRYRTSNSVEYNQKMGFPEQIDMFKTAIRIMETASKKDPDVALKLSSRIKGFNNVLKNEEGMLESFRRLHLVESKKNFERQFQAFLASRPDLKPKYGNVLKDITALYQNLRKTAEKSYALSFYGFVQLPGLVNTAYRYALEKQKPKSRRDPRYSQKRIQRTLQYLSYQSRQFIPEVDEAFLKEALLRITKLPADQRPALISRILDKKADADAEEAVSRYAHKVYQGTKYKSIEALKALFSKRAADFRESKDPLVKMVVEMYPTLKKEENRSKEFNGAVTKLREKYIRALFAWKGEKFYPDANRTLRFTYGEVKGYRPRDAVIYTSKTSLSGVVAKNTGKEPFKAPERLVELEKKRDFGVYEDPQLKDVPVNFLHTTDITGGNSGSPVLNGKGEFIGIAFDGNYEARSSDFQFNPALTRTISVDARYILYILDKFSGADKLLDELTIVEQPVTEVQ